GPSGRVRLIVCTYLRKTKRGVSTHDEIQPALLVSSSYSAADSRSGGSAGSPLPSCGTRTRNIQPAVYGSALTSEGSSSSSVLTSTTSPSTGEYRSLTDLTDSTSPHGSPAATAAPGAGSET